MNRVLEHRAGKRLAMLSLGLAMLGCVSNGIATAAPTTIKERYERAAEFLPWRVSKLVHGASVQPNWSADGRSFWFEEDTVSGARYWQVDLQGPRKTLLTARPAEVSDSSSKPARATEPGWTVSPNGRWAVDLDDNQIIRVDLLTGQRTPLTTDGVTDYRYGSLNGGLTLTRKRRNDPDAPFGTWSPDGERFLTYRVDERQLHKQPVLMATEPGKAHQLPSVHFNNTAYRYSPKMQRADLMVFDMRDGGRLDLRVPKPFVASNSGVSWSRDGSTVFVGLSDPGGVTSTAYAVDAKSGESRALVTDSREAEIDLRQRFSYLGNGEQVVVYSMRSDWGHLYLHDGRTGKLIRPLTQGEWAVSGVVKVDERQRVVYFTAKGRERGHHPDHAHLYRVSLNGGAPVLLTPENAQHDVSFSPDGKWFIDTHSTVTTAPVTVLRRADGKASLELVRADISQLQAKGWQPPIPFSVKSLDGRSDLQGVLYLPHDLDPTQSYPLIESGYFDGDFIQWQFLGSLSWHGSALAMSQLGFAVMEFEGREAGYRSSKTRLHFEDPQMTEPSFYDDRIHAMRELAKRYPFIDVSRVGVYGHSNGGWRAARALLQHPEFYKVGVAGAGSHDYGTWRATAPPKLGQREFEYPTNMEIAGNLQGKLLLMHGLIDDNVHVAQTFQLAQALIDHGKRFDMQILPELTHNNLWQSGYVNLRTWDYFVENLLHLTPPDVQLPEPGGAGGH